MEVLFSFASVIIIVQMRSFRMTTLSLTNLRDQSEALVLRNLVNGYVDTKKPHFTNHNIISNCSYATILHPKLNDCDDCAVVIYSFLYISSKKYEMFSFKASN
jgi:hypothetical protein